MLEIVLTREDGQALLWIDRHFFHEGSHHAFNQLKARGASVAYPSQNIGVADHYVPTRGRGGRFTRRSAGSSRR